MTVLSLLIGVLATEPTVEGLELEWSAPESCPTQAVVVENVRNYLTDRQPVHHVNAAGTIEHRPSGWHLSLLVDGVQRDFDSPHCGTLGQAAAVTLSLAIAPFDAPPRAIERRVHLQPQAVEDPRMASPPAASAPAPPRISETERWPRATLRWEGAGGYMPTPSASDVVMSVGVVWRRVRLDVFGSWIPFAYTPPNNNTSARVTAGSAGVKGCGVLHPWSVEIPLCAGVAAGAVRFDRPTQPRSTTHGPWLWTSIGPQLIWPAHRIVHFTLSIEGLFVLLRPRVDLPGGNSYRPSVAGVRGALGIELRFP